MNPYQLKRNKTITPPDGPVLLIIMDGIGLGRNDDSNAVYLANTPVLDMLQKQSLYTPLNAHGTAVGMPTDDDMGNSEVGHNALGAGQVFDQGAALVQNAISSGHLFNGNIWKAQIKQVKAYQSTLHFIGLLSDGNVHSHIDHVALMIKKAHESGVERCRIHILLDGRDVEKQSALTYIDQIEVQLSQINMHQNRDYAISSGGGRMHITMDRYHADWDMVKRGWQTHVLGKAEHYFTSAKDAIETFYQNYDADQYLPSFVITKNQKPIGTINDHDSVILFNFRGDRAIELSMAFDDDTFPYFDREYRPDVLFSGMMQYDGDCECPKHFLVSPPDIDASVSHYLCASGMKSFAVSETQKYGHVTYFWNGNKSGFIDSSLETYVEIPSYTTPFEEQPHMRAADIYNKTLTLLNSGNYHFGRINFPNGDMIGHTGHMEAVISAVEVTDMYTGKLMDAVTHMNGVCIILADHGNADEMFVIKNGKKVSKTCHTLNPVPCAIVGNPIWEDQFTLSNIKSPGLANVAATICTILGYEPPSVMEKSLIEIK